VRFRAATEQLYTAQSNLRILARRLQRYASARLYDDAKDGRISPSDTGLAFKFIAKGVLEARDEVSEAVIAIERGNITTARSGCSSLTDQTLFNELCQMHRELLSNCSERTEDK
jgi:DNA-binding transcriptional LysR family regulator